MPPSVGGRPRTEGNAVSHRQVHGRDQDVGSIRMAYRQADPARSAVRRDGTVGCSHVSAAGAPPKKETDPARGRRQGGFRSSLHLRVMSATPVLGLRAWVATWIGVFLSGLSADRSYDDDACRT